MTTSSPAFQRVTPGPTFHTTPEASEPPMWWPYSGGRRSRRPTRLAERRPDVVEVHAGGHDADDDLERARLGDLDLLDLEGVDRLALALLRMTHAAIVAGSSPGSVSTVVT
jgi:hypothetical protein